MLCIVQDLPFDVLLLLWKDWIKINELAMLDSAICSANIRHSLLSLLKHEFYIHNSQCELYISTDFVIWLSTRRIKTDHLDLYQFLDNKIPAVVVNYLSSTHITSLSMFYSANLLSILKMIGINLVKLLTVCEDLDSKRILSLILKIPNVTDLVIQTRTLLTCDDCQSIVDHCPSLTTLSGMGYKSVKSVEIIINNLNLTALNVPTTGISTVRVGTDTIDLITEKLSNLTDLSLSCQRRVKDESALKIADKCNKLKHLNLNHCDVSDVSVIPIVTKCQLVGLNISNTNITDETLLALSTKGNHCNLQTLVVSRTAITDKSVCRFITNCGAKIIELHMDRCKAVTDVSLACISTHCLKLKSFHCSRCEISDCSPIVSLLRFPMYSTFTTDRSQLSDILISVIHGFHAIAFTERLSKFVVAEPDIINCDIQLCESGYYSNQMCSVTMSEAVITSQLFRQIVLQCPNLESVQLDIIQGVCDDDILFLFEKCPLINTLTLKVVPHKLRQLNGSVLAKCAAYCHNLREFHLEHMDVVSLDQFVSFFAAIGKQMKYLTFNNCEGIDDDSLVMIAAHCPNLRRFNATLSHNEDVTPVTNKSILESCPLLEHLNDKARSDYRYLRQGAI